MISFRLDSPWAPHIEAERLMDDWAALEHRVERLCDEWDIPSHWQPAHRAMGLLLLVRDPDWALLENLHQRHLREPERPFGHGTSQTLLSGMANELDRVSLELETHGPSTGALSGELAFALRGLRGERLQGGCAGLDHQSIWSDAVLIGLLNGLGYLLGTLAQGAMETYLCKDDSLSYGERFASELVNRFVQHLVRFLGRDVLVPLGKQQFGLFSATGPDSTAKAWLQFLMAATLLSAADQLGVVVLKNLPPVPTTGDQQTPELWENSGQMVAFAGTDFVAWLAVGYLSQLLFKTGYEETRQPLEGLARKAVIHFLQVILDTLALSAWKGAHDGLNPNGLCLPGIDTNRVRPHNDTSSLPALNATEYVHAMRYNSTHAIWPGPSLHEQNRAPEYHLYALLLDGGELLVKALVDVMAQCCPPAEGGEGNEDVPRTAETVVTLAQPPNEVDNPPYVSTPAMELTGRQ